MLMRVNRNYNVLKAEITGNLQFLVCFNLILTSITITLNIKAIKKKFPHSIH